MSDAPVRTCPLCDADNSQLAPSPYSRGEWRIKCCGQCGFVYLENAPTYDDLASTFAWSRTVPDHEAERAAIEPRLYAFEKRFRAFRAKYLGTRRKAEIYFRRFVPRGEFLDVGCGTGSYIKFLGPELIGSGIELDHGAADVAEGYASKVGGTIYRSDAVTALGQMETDSFDGVLMRGYLEHETEPRAALAGVHRVVRPGGHILIQVPNYGSLNRAVRGSRWSGFRFPEHVNYFTPASLRKVVTEAGFEPVQFRLRDRLPTSDRMWLVAKAVGAASSPRVAA